MSYFLSIINIYMKKIFDLFGVYEKGFTFAPLFNQKD